MLSMEQHFWKQKKPPYHRNDVGDSVPGVDDGAREGPLPHLAGGPGRGQGQHSLHRDVQTRNVEGLKHDLCRVFPILRGVQWGFSLWEESQCRLVSITL